MAKKVELSSSLLEVMKVGLPPPPCIINLTNKMISFYQDLNKLLTSALSNN